MLQLVYHTPKNKKIPPAGFSIDHGGANMKLFNNSICNLESSSLYRDRRQDVVPEMEGK